jgi:hypothetical protein
MHDITFDKFGHHASSRRKNGLTDSIGANSQPMNFPKRIHFILDPLDSKIPL